MRVEVALPDLGEDGDSEITVSAWLSGVGDALSEGDDLVELTTDKAAFCLPCPRDGTLLAQRVAEGAEVRVGDVLCILDV